MRPTPQDLERALSHAPVIAVLKTLAAGDALRVGSACVTGGFRCLAVHGDVPGADDVIGSLTPRGDVIVGLIAPRDAGQLRDAAASGATFALGASRGEGLEAACRETGLLWVPPLADLGETPDPADWGHWAGAEDGTEPTS